MTTVDTANLLDVSFTNQDQRYHSNWVDVVQNRGYRSFAQEAETGATMRGRGFQAFTVHRQFLAELPKPLNNSMWRRKYFPALRGLWSTKRGAQLAIRTVHYAMANHVLVTCGKLIKQEAETQGAKSTAAHIWVNQAWLAFEPVLKQREKEPKKIWPKIMRSSPLSNYRRDAELKDDRWKGWTVHFAPWCQGFKVRDITGGMPDDMPEKLALAVKAASYALDFLANYAPFSFIYMMRNWVPYVRKTEGRSDLDDARSLTPLHKLAGELGPQSSRAAFDQMLADQKRKLLAKNNEIGMERIAELRLKRQRENRSARFREIREEKAALRRIVPRYRDHARLEALKEEAIKLTKSPVSSTPLTPAQELEIKEILDQMQKVVDAA